MECELRPRLAKGCYARTLGGRVGSEIQQACVKLLYLRRRIETRLPDQRWRGCTARQGKAVHASKIAINKLRGQNGN